MGVYTHLNFAFAGIDPLTFKIVPAQVEDVALYKRLTDLKKYDPELKVFIAIGGWTFNDPGPTFHTFSHLAADESRQRTFFQSLISFMDTYNFDGVDIDWEYPETDERGGASGDYANFPSFMRNLKAALDAGAGGRNGVSATLPVSFWYLRHFDIVELEKWVDFFNIMSYDLHGLWDKGNKWIGAYLNSHTNMTEITEYLDLLWRNDIKPDKVTLGLAFYSRTFLAADPSCTQAKCMFDSVGEAGPCSKDDVGGTLTNAELTDQIRAAGVTPTLDKDAMVKVAVIGRTWLTYDDEDTFKLKVDVARKMCLGGVMVWAVSQDYTANMATVVGKTKKRDTGIYDKRYSAQLQSATRYKSLKAIEIHGDAGDVAEPSPSIVRNQCYWANCGVSCDSGYTTVPRLDSDGYKNEVMQDSYHCQGGTLRRFCCPSNKATPKCGWFDFRNGKCGYRGACPAGSESVIAPSEQQREIGSTRVACNNGKAQVACCQTADDAGKALDSMIGYDMCKWFGAASDNCAALDSLDFPRTESCRLDDPSRPVYDLETLWGSGATYCTGSDGHNAFRPLCCNAGDQDRRWLRCSKVIAERKGNFCQAYCPAGTIRRAMEQPEVYENCKGGANAVCCEPRFLTAAKNEQELHHGYVEALQNVLPNPEKCDWSKVLDSGRDRKRGVVDFVADCRVALRGTMNLLGSPDVGLQQRYSNDWDLATNNVNINGVEASYVQSLEGSDFRTAPSRALQTDIAIGVLNSANVIAKEKKRPKKPVWECPPEWVWDASVDDSNDPDDGGLEVLESEFQHLNINSRRSLNLNPNDVPRPAVDKESTDTDSSSRDSSEPESDPLHEPDLDSVFDFDPAGHLPFKEPTTEEWKEAVEALRRFRIKDVCSARASPYKAENNPHMVMPCSSDEPGSECGIFNPEHLEASHQTMRSSAKQGRKRYSEIAEQRLQRKDQTVVARDSLQLGRSRRYIIKAGTYEAGEWPGEIIESSAYPNGNQGDDLIDLNDDTSRYTVRSQGCGPQGYELLTRAAKSDRKGIWVTEHILELNTIGRFITASLDFGLPGLDSTSFGPVSLERVSMHEVQMFVTDFRRWSDHTAITAADSCLVQLGSMQNRVGLVVCDSPLNQIKTSLYKLHQPVSDVKWRLYAAAATPQALQHALAYIQAIMAVFDYYDDVNVKNRHARAYYSVQQEMALFEKNYREEFNRDIFGQWQIRWREFIRAHLERVEEHARTWARTKLVELRIAWRVQLWKCFGGDVGECIYIMLALSLLEDYIVAIDLRQKIQFDRGIFGGPW